MIMDRLYGGVCYAGIDTDPELKYPKGAGRVAFSNQQSYIAAISARFVQLQHGDIDKRVHYQIPHLSRSVCDSLGCVFHALCLLVACCCGGPKLNMADCVGPFPAVANARYMAFRVCSTSVHRWR